jgi:DNA replication and repair protein RecF
MRFGYTQLGPHRADFDIAIEGTPVKHFLSRGQQKLLICAMIIAQGQLLETHVNKGLIYLVDDLPAELDLISKQKLIALLARQQTQIFITTIESTSICDFFDEKSEVPMKVFHVEHGNIVEMAGLSSHKSLGALK